MGKKRMVRRVGFCLEEDLYQALVRAGRELGVSRSHVMRGYLREGLGVLPTGVLRKELGPGMLGERSCVTVVRERGPRGLVRLGWVEDVSQVLRGVGVKQELVRAVYGGRGLYDLYVSRFSGTSVRRTASGVWFSPSEEMEAFLSTLPGEELGVLGVAKRLKGREKVTV